MGVASINNSYHKHGLEALQQHPPLTHKNTHDAKYLHISQLADVTLYYD